MNRQTIHGPGVYVIGVTGSIASGKSLVGQQLQKLGVGVFDVDHLTHELLNNPGPVCLPTNGSSSNFDPYTLTHPVPSPLTKSPP